MKKLLFVLLIIVLVSALVLGACAQPAPSPTPKPSPSPIASPTPAPTPSATTPAVKPIELKFAHQNPPKSRLNVYFVEAWSKKVEEATNGKVKITNYPAETLAKAAEMIDAVKGGVADMSWQTLGMFAGRFPLTSVSTIPFLNLKSGKVDGRTASGGAINSRILWELCEKFPEIQAEFADVKLLFLYASDPYFLISKKPVRNLADLKGMKIRETAGPPTEMWKLFGASPINVPMPGIYEAGDKGVLDGAGMLWSGLGSFKLYEVFRYRTVVDTYIAQFFVIMNKDKWNKLPHDVQQAITKLSGLYGAEFVGDACFGLDAEQDIRNQMKQAGKEIEDVNLEPGQLEKWKQLAGKPLIDTWLAEANAKGLPGQKVLDEALRLLEKYRIK